MKRGIFLLGLIVLLTTGAYAQSSDFTHVIVNSENWRDVYSTMHYANLKGVGSDFLVSSQHGPILLNGISKQNDILVVSSRRLPFVINYDALVEGQGFSSAQEIIVEDANLELIDDLPDVRNFVIVGDTYGYSAIATVPYAVTNNAWVFFANRVNVDEIEFILSNRDVDEVLIYGFVEREVRDALEAYNPVIIDTGDRFKDNVEIVKRQSIDTNHEQILLTNGEFIEGELMSGAYPILFTGKNNVPEVIGDYIKNSDIQVGVLIGGELVGAATNIRRETGTSIIVKFARGARSREGPIASVEGLDLFYLPIPILELELHSAKYNSAASQLELTYYSNSNIPVFFKGTITPLSEDINDRTRLGDVDPIFIAPNDYKTVTYPDVIFTDDSAQLEVFTLYGDTPTSLERILEATIGVELVNVIDGCDISLDGVEYRKPKDSFAVIVDNVGNVDCWVDVELHDIIVDGSEQTLGAEGSVLVRAGKSERIYVPQLMSDEDLARNNLVTVVGYYGEREDSLVKVIRGTFDLSIVSVSLATIGLVALTLIVVIAIAWLLIVFIRRRRDDDFDDFY